MDILRKAFQKGSASYHSMSSSNSQKIIVVFGAGVVGLQTALSLAEAGYKVKVLSKKLPGDLDDKLYSSPWAASTWACDASVDDSTIEQDEFRNWYIQSYNYWKDLSVGKGEKLNDTGVARRTYFRYWVSPEPWVVEKGASAYWYRDLVSNFRTIPNETESLPSGVKFGVAMTSYAIDAPKYLEYMKNRIISLGGTVTRAVLPTGKSLAEVVQAAKAIVGPNVEVYAYVNATGLGAKELIGDNTIFPLRSHSIYIKGEADEITDRLDDGAVNTIVATSGDAVPITYTIPRVGKGFTVLGGYMQENSWDTKVDPVVSAKLLEAAKFLAPELKNSQGEFEVIDELVGLRPHRTAGLRLEVEYVQGPAKLIPVIHNYGHGHGGFLKSVGSATKVVSLVNGLKPQGPVQKL